MTIEPDARPPTPIGAGFNAFHPSLLITQHLRSERDGSDSELEEESSDEDERGVWELSDEGSVAEAEWDADDVPKDPCLSAAEILEEEFDLECMSADSHRR